MTAISIPKKPTLKSHSPIDGYVVGEAPAATPESVKEAMTRARRAARAWREMPIRARAAHLRQIRKKLIRDADAWSRLITKEIGKPLLEALGGDVLAAADGLKTLEKRGVGWLAPRPQRLWLTDFFRGVQSMQAIREPLGVIGIIGTWNFPLAINMLQIASALLCGNVVLWKPSERAVAVARRMEELFHDAHLPPDVVQVIYGDGEAGEALAQAGCDKILFTGSHKVGRRLLEVLGKEGIPALVEMSGADAALVFPDADIERAARGIAWGAMANAGQTCAASRRVIVHEEVYGEFCRALLEKVQALRVGDPFDAETDIGPLRAPEYGARLEGLLKDAVKDGARILAGGHSRNGGRLCYFEPTLVTNINPSWPLWREEYFGPVALVHRAKDEEEMISLANRSPFGLGASLWTDNLRKARRWASRIDAGVVWVNDVLVTSGDMRVPFGGVKASGYGRVHGPEGLWELTRIKWVERCSALGFRPYYFPYGARKLKRFRDLLRWRHR